MLFSVLFPEKLQFREVSRISGAGNSSGRWVCSAGLQMFSRRSSSVAACAEIDEWRRGGQGGGQRLGKNWEEGEGDGGATSMFSCSEQL